MKKLMYLVLLLLSFNCNALVGDTHENNSGNTFRILPKSIKIVKGNISAVVEANIDGRSYKYLSTFSKQDCQVGYGIVKDFSLNSNNTDESMVFLEGSSIVDGITRDMCDWALQHSK